MILLQLFWSTVSFLTILPVPASNKILPQEEFSKGILFYTLIGLLVGLIDYICYGAMVFFFKMPLIGAVFAVLSETIVTGGFHLDGLADTCDGFFSARKKEKMLEIMKDSRVGTNGALALLFDIVLKVVFLVSMAENEGYLAVLLAPVSGKMATPILMKTVRFRKFVFNTKIYKIYDSSGFDRYSAFSRFFTNEKYFTYNNSITFWFSF